MRRSRVVDGDTVAPSSLLSARSRATRRSGRAHFDKIEERIDRLEKTVSAAVDLLHRLLHPDKRSSPGTPASADGARCEPRGPLACVVGARPNYMKMAPLVRAFARAADLPRVVLVHTGQHYDVAMNERLFADLELPAPDINLEVGSGTHAVQTAEIMRRFEPVLDELAPVLRRSSSATSTRRSPAAWSPPRSACRSCTSKRGCAASTATCRRRSTASSPTRSPTALHHRARGRRQPRARRHRAGAHPLRRQRDDRLAACSIARGRSRRRDTLAQRRRRCRVSSAIRRLRRRHAAPAVERRRHRGAARSA